jgi:hypothetical protein
MTEFYKKYLVKISKRYAGWQNLDKWGDIGRELKNINQ